MTPTKRDEKVEILCFSPQKKVFRHFSFGVCLKPQKIFVILHTNKKGERYTLFINKEKGHECGKHGG